MPPPTLPLPADCWRMKVGITAGPSVISADSRASRRGVPVGPAKPAKPGLDGDGEGVIECRSSTATAEVVEARGKYEAVAPAAPAVAPDAAGLTLPGPEPAEANDGLGPLPPPPAEEPTKDGRPWPWPPPPEEAKLGRALLPVLRLLPADESRFCCVGDGTSERRRGEPEFCCCWCRGDIDI